MLLQLQLNLLLILPLSPASVQAVAWVEKTEEGAIFASASHDQVAPSSCPRVISPTSSFTAHPQTVHLFRWNATSNSVESVNSCR